MIRVPPSWTSQPTSHVRSRERPWGLHHLTPTQRCAVHVGNTLLIRYCKLCRAVARNNDFYFLEHPEDRGRPPYPSIFVTDIVRQLAADTRATSLSLDEGCFGSLATKGTTLLGTAPGLYCTAGRRVSNRTAFKPLRGKLPSGEFASAALQVYPPAFNDFVAKLYIYICMTNLYSARLQRIGINLV